MRETSLCVDKLRESVHDIAAYLVAIAQVIDLPGDSIQLVYRRLVLAQIDVVDHLATVFVDDGQELLLLVVLGEHKDIIGELRRGLIALFGKLEGVGGPLP